MNEPKSTHPEKLQLPERPWWCATCPHCKRLLSKIKVKVSELEEPLQDHMLANWVRCGLTIQRMTFDQVAEAKWDHAENCYLNKESTRKP